MSATAIENSEKYGTLLSSVQPKVLEHRDAYRCFSERHLQAMWLEQQYFTGLVTAQGHPITVVSPGIWNCEAGPDFRRAHIRIGETEYVGDVELHLSEEDWYSHGHDRDARYNGVILHVALWRSSHPQPLLTHTGQTLVQTYLEPHLTVPTERVVQLLDLDLYPYKKFVGSGRCAGAIFNRVDRATIEDLFFSAALWRLERKRICLSQWVSDPDKRLAAGIAMGLGYKHNTQRFLEIWLELCQQADFSERHSLAWVLGKCGYFVGHYASKWKDSSHYQALKQLWEELGSPLHPRYRLTLDHIRPVNNPVRRLATLCMLVNDPSITTLFDRMTGLWDAQWRTISDPRSCRHLVQGFVDLLPTYDDIYWSYHYSFEQHRQPKALALMGKSLKQEIVINTVFPLLVAHVRASKSTEQWTAFALVYRSLVTGNSSKTRYLQHRFFGSGGGNDLFKTAAFEQGAFQLHHDFCTRYEASCEGCPFVDRFYEQRWHRQ